MKSMILKPNINLAKKKFFPIMMNFRYFKTLTFDFIFIHTKNTKFFIRVFESYVIKRNLIHDSGSFFDIKTDIYIYIYNQKYFSQWLSIAR
jgi:hypothetical protein